MWNLAVEQYSRWQPGRKSAPSYGEQCRQLTEARAEFAWLRAGSQTVQQQALRDFAQAMRNFFGGTHRRPSWRKAGRHEGFRQVAVKPGRWHIAFASRPAPVPAPGTGQVVGIDRGVTVSAALSTGELLHCPGLRPKEAERLRRLQQQLARCRRGSNRRARVKAAIARLAARQVDRRKNWAENTSTRLAREFDVIRVEDLRIRSMTRSARGTRDHPGRRVTQKTGLNRAILSNGWGLLVTRLEHKAPGRVEKIKAAYTSQTCAICGHCAPESRESQAVFRCVAREPQLATSSLVVG